MGDHPQRLAGSRRFAEEWAYRFLGAAVGDVQGRTEKTPSAEPGD